MPVIQRLVSRPGWLVVLPALLSFVVWVTPWSQSVRRGFDNKEPLALGPVIILAAWYGWLAFIAMAGWLAGRSSRPISSLDAADDEPVYRSLTWIGGAGVLGMYAIVELHAPGLILAALREHQFNLVRQAVPMAPGIATLRYATVLTGAIALHGVVILRERRKIHYLNVVLLALNVMAASRLALIMALLLFVGLWVTRASGRSTRARRGRLLLLGLAAVGLLTYANYARNATYYEDVRGTQNPYSMMLSETVTYLGSPTQVALATTTDRTVHLSASEVESGVGSLITPSFFDSTTVAPDTEWYRKTVSIDPGLTTNSVLAQVYGEAGFWAIPVLSVVFLIAGFVMGHLSRYRSYMMLGAFVIGYCFAETWRVYLFSEGIIWFVLIALVASCAWSARRSRRGRASVNVAMSSARVSSGLAAR